MAVAKSYAKLLSYKDEYEVARLFSDGRWEAKTKAVFEGDYQLVYLLAPPLLGTKKRRFGSWLRVVYSLLARLKFLRGTPFDVFGYFRERREERWMIQHFESVITELLGGLHKDTVAFATRIAALPQAVKGYGHVKRNNMELWLAAEMALLEEFRQPPDPVGEFDTHGGDKRDRKVA